MVSDSSGHLEYEVSATTAGHRLDGRWQRAVLVFEVSERLVATVAGVDVDDEMPDPTPHTIETP
jgi:hypothetical protein